MAQTSWTFGPFTLLAEQRALLRDHEPVALGSRAFDLLVRLVSSAGRVVSKEELMTAAWSDTVVDETNLRVHIAALRKALGDERSSARYISNVPLRGYAFVHPVHPAEAAPGPKRVATRPPPSASQLPADVKRLVGRAADLERITALLSTERLVTICGAGGIGKTVTAIAAARAAARAVPGGARLVELASLVDPRLVPTAVASALDVRVASGAPLDALVTSLESTEVLLIIDNCEHVLDAVTELIEGILRGTKNVRFLATSREALRAEGETVHRLPSLELPTLGMTEEAVRASPAAALLLERASAVGDATLATDLDLPSIIEICRRLDGIPLALELAAGLVPMFGIRGLAGRLDDRFAVLTRGARTALPRQRTLRATFDWSYALLTAEEQLVFRRISTFRGTVSVDAVRAVVGEGIASPLGSLSSLVDKSLLMVHVGDEPEFRMLESARAYAFEQLRACGECTDALTRHARYLTGVFASANWRSEQSSAARQLARWLDDARAALDWAFSPEGDRDLGVELTSVVAPLWTHLALYDESRRHYSAAIQHLETRGPSSEQALRQRMELHTALVSAILLTTAEGELMLEHAEQARAIAVRLHDVDYELRTLWALWASTFMLARHRQGLERARTFLEEASRVPEAATRNIGDRLAAVSLTILGDHRRAAEHFQRFLASATPNHVLATRFTMDQWVTAQSHHARALWMLGRIDESLATAEASLAEARKLGHDTSIFYALLYSACPIPIALHETITARRHVKELVGLSLLRGTWHTWTRCFEGMLLVEEGHYELGRNLLRSALSSKSMADSALTPIRSSFTAAIAEAALALDDLEGADRAADEAMRLAETNEEDWILPNLLRLKAEACGRDFDRAQVHYERSLALSETQGALYWKLRTVASLARTLLERGDAGRARDVLAPVVAQFAGAPAVRDVIDARRLLARTESRSR